MMNIISILISIVCSLLGLYGLAASLASMNYVLLIGSIGMFVLVYMTIHDSSSITSEKTGS